MSSKWVRIGMNHSKIKRWAAHEWEEVQTNKMSGTWLRMHPLLICKQGSLCFNIQFFMDKMKNAKKKRKMAKKFTLPHWDLNPGFLNITFPPKIWILREIRSIELTVLKKSGLYQSLAECH
jgi:hypothetical protein